jgi:hypothetical protein
LRGNSTHREDERRRTHRKVEEVEEGGRKRLSTHGARHPLRYLHPQTVPGAFALPVLINAEYVLIGKRLYSAFIIFTTTLPTLLNVNNYFSEVLRTEIASSWTTL